MVPHSPYHALLEEAFKARREKNPSYSLRAFSRSIGISVTTLSKVLRYQRTLSPKNIRKLASFLELSPFETEALFPNKFKPAKNATSQERLLAEDEFKVISDWFYFAILNLAQTTKCRADAPWVAKRLGISSLEAHSAILRLERMGFLERKAGRLHRTVNPMRTTSGVPNTAIKKLHRQQLELARQAIYRVPLDKQDITSVTIAIDPAKIGVAKKKIEDFRNYLADLLEEGEKKEVYLLSVQLFPLRNWGDTQ